MQERRMMGIIQTFTKQHPKAKLGTILRTMQGMITNKAMTHRKEQVSIGTGQMRKHIDNLNTTLTLECSKGNYNAKIRKQKSLLRSHQQPI
jgi:hypothetical protein